MTTPTPTAFAAPLALPTRCARASAHVSRRACRPRTAVHAARMSLVSELLVKAVEVGAATYATTLLSTPAGREGAAQGVAGAVPSFEKLPAQVRDALSAAERLAGELPAVVARGTPESRKWIKLGLCLAIDLFGSGSLPVPFLADALDIVWAPVAALALHALFANPVVTAAGFAEEILPGTDGIPTASLAWIYEHYGEDIQKGLRDYGVTEVAASPVDEKAQAAKKQPFGGAFRRPSKKTRTKSSSRTR